MAQQQLETRVAVLEKQMAEIQTRLANGRPAKDWRKSVGLFTGDEVMERICQAALKYREADREKARRRWTKRSRRKK